MKCRWWAGYGYAGLTILVGLMLLAGCSSTPEPRDAIPRHEPYSKYGNPASYEVFGKRYQVLRDNRGYREIGIASWYGPGFHGKRTSSGETYDMYAMTAAHRTLRIPTYVEVTNLENGRRVVVRVNDRGPFHDNRIIDLSQAAAQKLGIIGKGTALVEVRHLESGDAPPSNLAPSRVARETARGVVEHLGRAVPEWGRNVFIQVGAFSKVANAQRLRERLVAGRVRQVHINLQADGLYRVRVGPLASLEEADRLAERLHQLGVYNQHMVLD